MGRIYDHIRRDIEKLKQIDEAIKNKELISMDEIFEASIALKKIEYVYTYYENEFPKSLDEVGRFPNGELENFNIPENFEDIVDTWEDELGNDKVNQAIRHLDLQDKAEPYIPELADYNPTEYYNYVKGTLDDICSISSRGRFGISREGVVSLAISAHEEFVKVCKEQDFTFDPYDRKTEKIQDFIYNPIEPVIEDNVYGLVLDDGVSHTTFIKEHTKEFDDLMKSKGIRKPLDDFNSNYVASTALGKIRQSEWNAEALSNALKDSVATFVELANGRAGKRYPTPSLGEFISMARERMESTLLDRVVPLGDDPSSKFLKDFLKDPITTLENSFNNDPNLDRHKLANLVRNERDNYNEANQGKADIFATLDAARKSRFESLFNNRNMNFDPATFKQNHQGSTFERFLGRTSREWTELSDYVDSWKNIENPRDFNRAENLAQNYLRHKFPNVDPKNVTKEMVQGLRGAGRERGLFCLSLVQSKIQAEEEINQTIFDTAKEKFDALEVRLHRGKSFSDMLNNDINDNEISNNINKEDNAKNNNIIKDNDIEI